MFQYYLIRELTQVHVNVANMKHSSAIALFYFPNSRTVCQETNPPQQTIGHMDSSGSVLTDGSNGKIPYGLF